MKQNKISLVGALILISFFISLLSFVAGLDRENSLYENKFSLKLSLDVFKFKEANMPEYKRLINKDIDDLKNEYLDEFKSSFNDFVEEEFFSPQNWNELKINSKVYINNPKLFCAIFNIYCYHSGSNGTHMQMKSFNYIIKNNIAKKVSFKDIAKDEKSLNKLIKLAIDEIVKTKGKDALFDSTFTDNKKTFIEDIEFTFSKDELIIGFNPYSIACGAAGILFANLKYEEVKNLLTPEILNLLNL